MRIEDVSASFEVDLTGELTPYLRFLRKKNP